MKVLILPISIFIVLQLINPTLGHAMGYGEDCVPGDTEHYCDPALHVDCINLKCECVDGFSVNSTEVCEGVIGTSCGDELNSTCLSEGFLACSDSDSTCQCPKPEEQIFDTILNACAQPFNTTCPMDHVRAEADEPGCIANAYCEMEHIGEEMRHYCNCNEGYVPSDDHTMCLLALLK